MQNQNMKEGNKNVNGNRLATFRRRRGLSQRQMAKLLDHQSHAALWTYEHGVVIPSLETALKLEIILRTPVAFLFPNVYEMLRNDIRAKEEKLAGFGQQDLFNSLPTRL